MTKTYTEAQLRELLKLCDTYEGIEGGPESAYVGEALYLLHEYEWACKKLTYLNKLIQLDKQHNCVL